MAKGSNSTGSDILRVSLSDQSLELLEQLARRGIYGRNPAEVAGRFIDRALSRFVDRPRFPLKVSKQGRGKEG